MSKTSYMNTIITEEGQSLTITDTEMAELKHALSIGVDITSFDQDDTEHVIDLHKQVF